MVIVENTSSSPPEPKSGYDLPVYGLDNGSFYYIHIPAILCICTSLTCAVITITRSFKRKSYRTYFERWSKSERFIVYLAICDGLFNVAHFTDHMHIVIVRDHVHPKELCELYGFFLAEFITAQNLMVNIVAVNAFMLMYFNKHLEFGKWDWKLLVWTFGTPFVGATIAGIAGQLGPNGTFCYFDGVKGNIANLCFTTIPLVIILVMNIVLYILTWKKIRDQVEMIEQSVGHMSAAMRASHRAARAMSLFVFAFLIQWWAMAVYGIWGITGTVIPQALFHLVTTFSNIGGVLNLAVYIILHRKQLAKGEHVSEHDKDTTRDSNKVDLRSRLSNSSSTLETQVVSAAFTVL